MNEPRVTEPTTGDSLLLWFLLGTAVMLMGIIAVVFFTAA
jgi:hypothetical protein